MLKIRRTDKRFLESFGISLLVIDNCVLTQKWKDWRIKLLQTEDWEQSGYFAFNLKTREVKPLSTQDYTLALDILKSLTPKERKLK